MEKWIIAISNSEGDGTDLYKAEAPYGAVKRTVQKMMREAKENEGDAFDYSIPVEGNEEKSQLYGCIVCADHHIDFTATKEKSIPDTEVSWSLGEMRSMVKVSAQLDGCIHYILKRADGTLFQICDTWCDNIETFVKENNMEVLEVIEPYYSDAEK